MHTSWHGQGGFVSNRPFYSCGLTILSCICRENVTDWGWTCFVTNLFLCYGNSCLKNTSYQRKKNVIYITKHGSLYRNKGLQRRIHYKMITFGWKREVRSSTKKDNKAKARAGKHWEMRWLLRNCSANVDTQAAKVDSDAK